VPVVAAEELAMPAGPTTPRCSCGTFAEEVMAQQHEFRAQGGRFVIPLPKLTVA
jgi:hypothetical protein